MPITKRQTRIGPAWEFSRSIDSYDVREACRHLWFLEHHRLQPSFDGEPRPEDDVDQVQLWPLARSARTKSYRWQTSRSFIHTGYLKSVSVFQVELSSSSMSSGARKDNTISHELLQASLAQENSNRFAVYVSSDHKMNIASP